MTLRALLPDRVHRRTRSLRALSPCQRRLVRRCLKRQLIDTPYQIGKFTVSPLSRRDVTGRYCPTLSIRSGHGSMTRDRVFRFLPTFDSPDEASRFADIQARTWLLEEPSLAAPAKTTE